MKTKLLKFFFFSLVVAFTACNKKTQNAVNIEYKFADKPEVINCEGVNTKLLNEALYSFEEDISQQYTKNNENISRAYASFFRNATSNRVRYNEVISKHTSEVFEALKNESDLWATNNQLNYNAPIFKCIGNNIADNDLKTTFNALLSTNSMSPTLFGGALQNQMGKAVNDKYLAMYIALDYYYAKLFDLDFTKINFDKPQSNVDFNKIPPKKPVADPHAGHNH